MGMTSDSSRTHHASQAAQVSDLINLKFATKTFGTEAKRYLRATEPDGPSTDGGRKARQALLLVTKDEMATGGGLVCGYVDVAMQLAEIRTYAVVSTHFSQRHGRGFDVSKGEYDRMQEQLEAYLAQQGFHTKVATTPRRASGIAHARPASAQTPIPAAVLRWGPIAGAAVAGFLLCYLLVRLGWL